MLANQIGYYSLILGLLSSFLVCTISIKDFNNNNKRVNQNVFVFSDMEYLDRKSFDWRYGEDVFNVENNVA